MCLDGDAQIDWVLGANSVVGGWVGGSAMGGCEFGCVFCFCFSVVVLV